MWFPACLNNRNSDNTFYCVIYTLQKINFARPFNQM